MSKSQSSDSPLADSSQDRGDVVGQTKTTTGRARLEAADVVITAGEAALEGELVVPPGAPGVVVFAHGSGSSRHSQRNRYVASVLQGTGLGTLVFDLLTPEEAASDEVGHQLRFDIALLARRLVAATRWLVRQPAAHGLAIGFFGASTGGAAALVAAAELGAIVRAVVSRGGRPDLAGGALREVRAPTLLIVGGYDGVVIELNEVALERMICERQLRIIPGATHLFEETGRLEQVARLSAEWFARHLGKG